jgi:hypothetical protein
VKRVVLASIRATDLRIPVLCQLRSRQYRRHVRKRREPARLSPVRLHTLQSVNPGFDRSPITPLMPEYMVPWINGLPAGELHPQIDEMAGMAPNTLTPPNGGPGIEFPEIMFGADLHCALYDPTSSRTAPNFDGSSAAGRQVISVSAAPSGYLELCIPSPGYLTVPNRVLRVVRQGASVAQRGIDRPYFHTGSSDTAPG